MTNTPYDKKTSEGTTETARQNMKELEDRFKQQNALELVQSFVRGHDAGWQSALAHLEAQRGVSQALTDYILQDGIHNQLTPRVVDIAYSAFMLGRAGKNKDDGGPCDWFNDTKPMVMEQIAKIRKDLAVQPEKRLTGFIVPKHHDPINGASIPDPLTFGPTPATQQKQEAAPALWKLVPVEPTQEMIEFADAIDPDDYWVQHPVEKGGTKLRTRDCDAVIYYRAMLASAPQLVPQQAQRGWCSGCNPDNCSGCGGAPEAVDGFSNHTQQEPVDYLNCDIRQVRYMDIHSRPGTKVIFHGRGGYDSEKDRAEKSLVLGNTYTVKHVEVSRSSSSVRLQEVEGVFNTVMFGPAVQ